MPVDEPSRVAIVTGGSRGIGRAVAQDLAGHGFAVAILYAQRDAEAEEAVRELRSDGAIAAASRADVADERAVRAAFDQIEEQWGGVDVVVNCAGALHRAPLSELALDDFDRIVRTNLRGAFVMTRLAAGRIREGGAIVNFSSTAVATALPGYTAYAASKAGVDALTLVAARELRGRDITVNAIAPGPVATEMFFADKDEDTVEFMRMLSPLERLAAVEEVARVVRFVVTEGRWINGQTLRVNGGVA